MSANSTSSVGDGARRSSVLFMLRVLSERCARSVSHRAERLSIPPQDRAGEKERGADLGEDVQELFRHKDDGKVSLLADATLLAAGDASLRRSQDGEDIISKL